MNSSKRILSSFAMVGVSVVLSGLSAQQAKTIEELLVQNPIEEQIKSIQDERQTGRHLPADFEKVVIQKDSESERSTGMPTTNY